MTIINSENDKFHTEKLSMVREWSDRRSGGGRIDHRKVEFKGGI